MKCDVELIRKILEVIAESDQGKERRPWLEGFTDDQVNIHKAMIVEAGLAKGGQTINRRGTPSKWYITHLTQLGHAFLTQSRSIPSCVHSHDSLGGYTLAEFTERVKRLSQEAPAINHRRASNS